MIRRWWFVDGAWSSFFHREVQPTSSFPHCQRFSRQFHITIPRQNMLLFNTMFTAQAALSLRALHAFLERIHRINGYECHTCLVFVNIIFFENTSEKTHFFLWHLSKNINNNYIYKVHHNHIYVMIFLKSDHLYAAFRPWPARWPAPGAPGAAPAALPWGPPAARGGGGAALPARGAVRGAVGVGGAAAGSFRRNITWRYVEDSSMEYHILYIDGTSEFIIYSGNIMGITYINGTIMRIVTKTTENIYRYIVGRGSNMKV